MEIEDKQDICIIEKKVKETLILQPNDLRNTKKCITEHIVSKLNKYLASEKGILIHYQKARRVEGTGGILDENPEILMDIKYKAKIFYPQKGKLLVGKITQVFQTHVTALVFGQFNALLWLCNIQSTFRIDEEEDIYCIKTGQKVEVGEYVQFEVAGFEVESEDNYQIIGRVEKTEDQGLCELIKAKHNLLSQFQALEATLMENQEKIAEMGE